jgi:hypothetical protein
MKILIACEESQRITIQMRALGLECYSCDIQDESGGYPQWHIKRDAIKEAYSGKYNLMIAHPPCQYLANVGNGHLKNKDGTINQLRLQKRKEAIEFVIKLFNAPIQRIAIENPISILSKALKKPSQYIHPWQFGELKYKKTCLWLKNLPLLEPTWIRYQELLNLPDNLTKPIEYPRNEKGKYLQGKSREAKKQRSKTFQGIAKAMAEQWGETNFPIQNELKLCFNFS